MDQRIQSLWRKHHADPADLAIVAQLFNLLMASGEVNLAKIVELRDSLDPENVDAQPIIRHISQYLYRRFIPYPTPDDWKTRRFAYDNRPANSSTWALVEFDETQYYSDVPDSVIAITGVYLINTAAKTYIASMSPSIETMPMYPNVIFVNHDGSEEQSAIYDEIGYAWSGGADTGYTSYHHLPKIVVEWFWIPEEHAQWQQEFDTEQEFIESLIEAYLANRVL